MCSLVIEDHPEGNLQGVYPLDTAHLEMVHQITEDIQEMVVDVIHHLRAGILMTEIIRLDVVPRIEEEIHHHQETDIHPIDEGQTRLIEEGIPQIEETIHQLVKEGNNHLKGKDTLQRDEMIHQIAEAGPLLEEIIHQEENPLKGNPHPFLGRVTHRFGVNVHRKEKCHQKRKGHLLGLIVGKNHQKKGKIRRTRGKARQTVKHNLRKMVSLHKL